MIKSKKWLYSNEKYHFKDLATVDEAKNEVEKEIPSIVAFGELEKLYYYHSKH